MIRRSFFALLWLGFIWYATQAAPPDQPDTLALIQQLATGQWSGINPIVIALFNLMGIWPLVYVAIALTDGHGQPVPAWPFVLGSFGLGAFLLLPYLFLRRPNPAFVPPKSWLIRLVDSRWFGAGLGIAAVALLAYGLYAGDWGDFIQQWQTSRFIHVMSLDFCLLWLLVPSLLGDDMARRGFKSRPVFIAVSAVPLLGAVAYLTVRPNLPDAPAS